jgi:2-polyprenyl-3-methyl-5-hydroxy-6-metoxy-1,4-benzoquinol methylase
MNIHSLFTLKNYKKRKKIENDVLKIYRKVSPSHRNLIDSKSKTQFFNQRINLFKTLGLPSSFFKNKKILEIGGGTGEKALFYAFYGAQVTIVEPNEKSCSIAKEIFSQTKLAKKLTVINKSLFDIDISIIKKFDMIAAEGVLHHTFHPIENLELILKNMVPNQIILIAIGESNGMLKRELQKMAVKQLAKDDPDLISHFVKKLFPEHLLRATKYDLRNAESVIYDNYVNPQDESSNLRDICNAFFKNKISYLSSYPKLDLFYITNPWSHDRENQFNYKFYQNYYKFLEKTWMTSGEEKISHDISDFDVQKITKRIDSDLKKLLQLKEKIETKNFSKNDLKIIKKGYMGVGLHYFLGMKDSNDVREFVNLLKHYKKT